MRLDVEHTWDGARIEDDEIVEIEATSTDSHLFIEVHAPFYGDPAPPRAPGNCPRLWEHEVVECFFVGDDERYLEVELGPHGHYLLLSLSGPRRVEREGMEALYTVTRSSTRWAARMEVSRDLLPGTIKSVNAFAIHGVGRKRRYFAFHPLPGDRPDFHQPSRFPLVSGL
jgi:hypothetical protein